MSAGTPSKRCSLDHDAAAAGLANQVGAKARRGLDVDVLGAEIQRVLENAAAFVLAARELAAFPPGAAGHDGGRPAALQRAGRIGTIDEVEPQFDDVGAADGVAAPADLLRRRTGHDHARFGCVNRHGSLQALEQRNEKSPLSSG